MSPRDCTRVKGLEIEPSSSSGFRADRVVMPLRPTINDLQGFMGERFRHRRSHEQTENVAGAGGQWQHTNPR